MCFLMYSIYSMYQALHTLFCNISSVNTLKRTTVFLKTSHKAPLYFLFRKSTWEGPNAREPPQIQHVVHTYGIMLISGSHILLKLSGNKAFPFTVTVQETTCRDLKFDSLVNQLSTTCLNPHIQVMLLLNSNTYISCNHAKTLLWSLNTQHSLVSSAGSADLLVSLKHGRIRGEYVTVKGTERRVKQYLGIPFARPPVGPLRFAAPQDAEPWEGERDSTHQPPM